MVRLDEPLEGWVNDRPRVVCKKWGFWNREFFSPVVKGKTGNINYLGRGFIYIRHKSSHKNSDYVTQIFGARLNDKFLTF